jgi:hypothetical protein
MEIMTSEMCFQFAEHVKFRGKQAENFWWVGFGVEERTLLSSSTIFNR